MKMLNKFYNRIYAWLFGYYWEPCPLCGEYMGGHEEKGKAVVWTDETKTSGMMTCKKHRYEESIIKS